MSGTLPIGAHGVADPDSARGRMRQRHLLARDIRDPAVLQAMMDVPRELFVPVEQRALAYADAPLPIGFGQTISQPYVVALMAQALQLDRGDRVLEVGGGSGYAAAVLGRLVQSVYTIERLEPLCVRAREVLARLGYDNVEVVCDDGTRGLPEQAPFDAILVAAGGPDIPRSLKVQLRVGGRMVIPVGSQRTDQTLIRATRTSTDTYEIEHLGAVHFVPLIGQEGWH